MHAINKSIHCPRLPLLVLALLASASMASPASDCALCFYGPDNMAVDRDGNVYMADTDHRSRSRILKLSKDGTKLAEWSGFRNVAGHTNGPEGIALALNGELLVTDGGALTIVVLSRALVPLRLIGGEGIFHDLGHVAIDAKGQVYVAEGEQNRIQKFTSVGVHIATWQMNKGNAPTDLNTPQGIGLLPDNRLVIEDWRNRRLVILDGKSGTPLSIIGGPGAEPGRLQNTSGLFIDNLGNILVAEQQLHRIQKFNAHGELLAVIDNTTGAKLFTEGPSAIAVDSGGFMLAPDGLSVVKFSSDGKIIARWR